MNFYLQIVFLVLIASILSYGMRKIIVYNRYSEKIGLKNCDFSNRFRFLVPCGILLILISGLRHNMGTDYVSYQYIFEHKIKEMSLRQILIKDEPLFAFIQKMVGEILGYHIVILMLIFACITVISLFYFFSRESELVWLSVFLTLTIGSYFTSFNTTRNYLTAVIWSLTVKFIYEKKFLLYFCCIIVLSLIHTSALIMLPMYWILRIKWFERKNWFLLPLASAVFLFVYFYTENIYNWIASFPFLPMVAIRGEGKLSLDYHSGTPWISIIRPLFYCLIIIINKKASNNRYPQNVVWENGALYFLIVQLISTKYYMFYRITYYMIPLAIVGLVHAIMMNKHQKNRRRWIFVVMVFAFAWGLLGGQFYANYRFFWQDNVIL